MHACEEQPVPDDETGEHFDYVSRVGFRNAGNTCCLAALLQYLYSASGFRKLLQLHNLGASCPVGKLGGTACAWCLLKEFAQQYRDSSLPVAVHAWGQFLGGVGGDWALGRRKQHDPTEAFRHMLGAAEVLTTAEGGALTTAINSMLSMRVREIIWTTPTCDSAEKQTTFTDREISEQVLELKVSEGDGAIWLSDLLGREGNGSAIDVRRPPCALCTIDPENLQSLALLGASPVLLLALNRTDVEQAVAPGEAERFKYKELRTIVQPGGKGVG